MFTTASEAFDRRRQIALIDRSDCRVGMLTIISKPVRNRSCASSFTTLRTTPAAVSRTGRSITQPSRSGDLHIVAFVCGWKFAPPQSLQGVAMRVVALVLVLFAVPVQALAQFCEIPAASFDPEIRRILQERVDNERRGVGLVVGLITPEGRRVISHGSLAQSDPRRLDGDTIFEIGSVGKVFTALLLADMVQRGEAALNDPVADYVPPGVAVPQRGERQITLLDLATHTSGLPRMPTNFVPRDPANPYADYSVEQLYGFLSNYQLTRDIGSDYAYSNVGYGLLGQLLARRVGTDYESLVKARISGPLSLTATAMTLPAPLLAKRATGHNETLQPVPNWDDTTLAGAGSLSSSVNDLLVFLSAELAGPTSRLGRDMSAMLATRRPTGTLGLEIALGWHVTTEEGRPTEREFVWHNGGTGGFSSFIGFCPQTRAGIVVLANSEIGVDDIAFHLMDRRRPLEKPITVTAGSNAIDAYVGRYQLPSKSIATVSRQGSRLFIEAVGQARIELSASDRRNVFTGADAQIRFDVDAQGRASRFVLHRAGADVSATRIE
jgi:serine-type D-Ala-D-Ala carboxypeptidase/endopeptidase